MMHFRHRSVCSCLYFLSKDFILIPHLEQKFAPTPNRNRLMRQSLQWNIWHKVNQFCLKSQTSSTCPRTFCTNRLSKNHYGFANGIVAVVCHNLTELPQMLWSVYCFDTHQSPLEPAMCRILDTAQSWLPPFSTLPEKNTACLSACCKSTEVFCWVVRSLPIEFAMLPCMTSLRFEFN